MVLLQMEATLESKAPPKSGVRRMLARFCTPIFLEAFILTFLAEWGDRSQIATIALASHKNPYAVTIGAIIGHSICTGVAVIGGRLLAMKVSQRLVRCFSLHLADHTHSIICARCKVGYRLV